MLCGMTTDRIVQSSIPDLFHQANGLTGMRNRGSAYRLESCKPQGEATTGIEDVVLNAHERLI